MESEKVVVDELPLAIVRRVVKNKLTECSPDYDVSIHKEALLAFSESARIFIHYLSATANDFCKDSRRQTMKADDVYKALEEMEFAEFLEPLKASLEEFKKKTAGKKAGAGTASKPSGGAVSKPKETKKRKLEVSSPQKSARKSKKDEVDSKNDEENEADNVEESGDAEENETDNVEESGDVEENDNDDDNAEGNGNDEEDEENEIEGNSMEENGNESGNEDNSMEDRSESRGDNENGSEEGEGDEEDE